MKTWLVLAPLALALLCGCTHQYVITLSNGTRITAASKPKLEHGTYTFKDAKGQPAYVSAGRVREIAPASMAKEEKNQFRSSGR